MEKKIQHAVLTTSFSKVEVLNFINEQRAYVKIARDLLHLLKSVVYISGTVTLRVILITNCLTDRNEKLLTETRQ